MFTKYNYSLSFLIFVIFTIVSCSGGEMEQKKVSYGSLKDVPEAAWKKLSEKKIYFGHQSVGFNIMDGITDLMKDYPQIKLNLVETDKPANFNEGIFAHSRVGKNVDPKSKIDEFVRLIDQGIGKKADAATLKFCYVDIQAESDVENIFSEYSNSVDILRNKYPGMTIVHFTEPLTVVKTTWKTRLKKILGKKDIWEYADNIKRNQYNELLLKKYGGKEPILDIAEIESTFPDGKRVTFSLDGKIYYAMAREYTKDGGHLNEQGRKKVAEQLLLLLANLG